MQWTEIAVRTSHQAMDIVAEICRDLGANGVVMEDPRLVNEYLAAGIWDATDLTHTEDDRVVTVKAYLPQDDNLPAKIQALERAVTRLLASTEIDAAPGEIYYAAVKDEDWANSWKQYWHTQKIGNLVLKPSWENYSPLAEERVIELDPGSAFGTGSHPTTQLALKFLTELLSPGMRVIDMGTGSGVLAIAAAKLGASHVTAADADAAAIESAQANVQQNNVQDKVTVTVSDLWQNVTECADLVVANIIADVIIRLLDNLAEHLAPGGKLIAGGIIASRRADVIDAAGRASFVVTKTAEDKDWSALVLERADRD